MYLITNVVIFWVVAHWGCLSTLTLSILTLSKVSFSDILRNDYLDHFDTFKNDTFESVWVNRHPHRDVSLNSEAVELAYGTITYLPLPSIFSKGDIDVCTFCIVLLCIVTYPRQLPRLDLPDRPENGPSNFNNTHISIACYFVLSRFTRQHIFSWVKWQAVRRCVN